MNPDIREADWKIFREIRPIALDRFCERVLSEMNHLAAEKGKGAHERYLEVFKVLDRRNEEIDIIFDYLRRSTAIRQIAACRVRGLISDEEFGRLSEETRNP